VNRRGPLRERLGQHRVGMVLAPPRPWGWAPYLSSSAPFGDYVAGVGPVTWMPRMRFRRGVRPGNSASVSIVEVRRGARARVGSDWGKVLTRYAWLARAQLLVMLSHPSPPLAAWR
jgi:hypothetical protein